MKIGIVTTWYERGAAYVSMAYMDSLIHNGYNVFIYVRGGEEFEKGDQKWDLPNITMGIRYTPLDKGFLPYNNQYINMIHFEKWLKCNQIDIIIFNEEHLFNIINRVKKLGYLVGAYIDYYKKETVESFKSYDFLLCNTKRHYSVFKNFENALYMPWGTDIELFRPKSKKESNDIVIFFHSAGWGGVNTRKGTDLLVRAFQKITGHTKLIIHSQAPLSKYGGIANIIENDSRIEFITKTVSAPGLYHLGDVFVYPTRLEGIGLSVPEALSCALPTITTNNAPMNEFVENNINGLLIDVAYTQIREDNYYWPESIVSIDSLTQCMQTYLDDRELLNSHKINARISAEKRLDWFKNSESLGKYLEEILEKSGNTKRNSFWYEKLIWFVESSFVYSLTKIRIFLRKSRECIKFKYYWKG